MPNWKYPCVVCSVGVKSNQKGICCDSCDRWIHLKCTNHSLSEYNAFCENPSLPYYCPDCISQNSDNNPDAAMNQNVSNPNPAPTQNHPSDNE